MTTKAQFRLAELRERAIKCSKACAVMPRGDCLELARLEREEKAETPSREFPGLRGTFYIHENPQPKDNTK